MVKLDVQDLTESQCDSEYLGTTLEGLGDVASGIQTMGTWKNGDLRYRNWWCRRNGLSWALMQVDNGAIFYGTFTFQQEQSCHTVGQQGQIPLIATSSGMMLVVVVEPL